MDTFDLDLEDLDLKSVDIKPSINPITTSNDFKSISFNGSSYNGNIPAAKPNLTVAGSNHDPMPLGLSSDKGVDFGLDLLMNKKKMRSDTEINKLGGSSQAPSPTHRPASTSGYNLGGNAGGFPEKVDATTELFQNSLFSDNITDIDLDKELSTLDLGDISKPKPVMSGPSLPTFSSQSANTTTPGNGFGGGFGGSSGANGAGMGGGGGYSSSGYINTGGVSSTAGLSFEEIQTKKFDLLCKFERLRDKGVRLPKTFSMSSSLDEMELEYKRLVEHRQMDNSVKMQRRMLISFASMLEFLNGKFNNPFDVHIEGWSEQLAEEIETYDDIFESLHEKYKDTVNMAPELKLVMMVGSSAFWYHLTSNMSKSMMPNLMNNVMKQNPDLMRQFQNATLNTMNQGNPSMANFMSGMTSGMNQGPPKYNPMSQPPFSNPRDAPPRGQTNINQTDDIDALIDSISS